MKMCASIPAAAAYAASALAALPADGIAIFLIPYALHIVTAAHNPRALNEPEQAAALDVALEGHGREPLEDTLNIERTVGWFTSMFPVRVALSGASLREQVENVSAMLHALPRKGSSFGIARYLAPAAVAAGVASPLPSIGFNYLGEFAGGTEHPAVEARQTKHGDNLSP